MVVKQLQQYGQACPPSLSAFVRSRYQVQNSGALLDAALALRTQRIRTPSPPGSDTACSRSEDIQERSVGLTIGRNNKEAASKNVEDSSVQAPCVADVGCSTEENKAELHLREKRNVPIKDKQATSEEEGGTATDTDNDYVEGKSTEYSSSETETEEVDSDGEEESVDVVVDDGEEESVHSVEEEVLEDGEEECADSGGEELQEECQEEGLDCGEEEVQEDGKEHSKECRNEVQDRDEKHSGTALCLAKNTAVKARDQEDIAMQASEEKERQNEGFEKWSTGKKARRKTTETKIVVPEENAIERCVPATNTDSATRRSKRKHGSGGTRRSEAKGTIVITEKEYRLLLSLKAKSTAESTEFEKDEPAGKTRAARGVGHVVEEENPGALVVGYKEPVKRSSGGPTTREKETESSVRNRVLDKGKRQIHENVAPANEIDSQEDRGRKGKRATKPTPDPPEIQGSDSDFQSTPEKQVASGRLAPRAKQEELEHASRAVLRKSKRPQPFVQATHAGDEIRTDNDDHRLELKRKERSGGHERGREILLDSRSLRASTPRHSTGSMKKKIVFPFEKVEEEEGLHLEGVGASAGYPALSDDNDDFEGEEPHRRGRREVMRKALPFESDARANRKRIKAEHDLAVQEREATGHKPFYIMVNALGTPYGDGLAAWKAEVSKLARGLDPSIRDIRHQPHQKIEILKKRLTDKFEYSDVISDKFLLPLLGQKVSGRRNELMTAIRAGKDCPSGVDKGAWNTLKELSGSSNFQRKSEAMRYANSCRQNVGRTGPGGEIRVRDSLKRALRRSPDPEEVQAEMNRDKGYGGKTPRMKQKAVRERLIPRSDDCSDEDVENVSGRRDPVFNAQTTAVTEHGEQSSRGVEKDASSEQCDIIKRMQAEIEILKKKVDANVSQASSVRNQAPSHPAVETAP